MSSSRSGRNPEITEFVYVNKNTGEQIVEKVSEPAYTRRRRLAKEREEMQARDHDQREDETVDITVSVPTGAPTVIIVLPKAPDPQPEQMQPQQQNDGFPIVVPIKKGRVNKHLI